MYFLAFGLLAIMFLIPNIAPARTYIFINNTSTEKVLTYSYPIPEIPEEEPEDEIRRIAKETGFKWTNYLIKLAKCENSTLDRLKTNSRGNYPVNSTDRGIFMINDYWHSEVPDECAFNIDCATRWTIERINNGYQKEWTCNEIVLAIDR